MKPIDQLPRLTPSGHDLDRIVDLGNGPHSIRQTMAKMERLAADPRAPECARQTARFYLARFDERFGYKRRERRIALACGVALALCFIVLLAARIWT
jgi:hypothetical protein